MAATAMSLAKTVVGGVLKELGSKAVDEVAKTLGVRKDVWYIIGELDMIQSFLMAAETRRDDNIIIKTWMRQVKDLAYQIEDCLAEFHLHLENRDLFHKLRTLKTRHRIASNIRDIRAKVQEVSQRNQRYNLIKPLDSSSDAASKYVNLASRAIPISVEESKLVGQSEPKEKLIKLINENENENNKYTKVIWVTGMGGLGKTTLVKMVYDSHEVSHFTFRAWVVVSQQFDIRDLLMNILGYKNEKITTPDLVKNVKTRLENEVFLVVLDDLWTLQAWNDIKHAFPENNKSSRIVITTRNKNVAEACGYYNYEIYPLRPLSDVDSRNLLLKKINKDSSFPENEGLENEFEKIIKKCQGLPLAVVTIGGLLASKPENKEEWEKLLNRLSSELETNSSTDAVRQILDLSYIDLPYHLKPCLLYLSIFPEDYEIKCSMLVHRWMAEGYVRERRGMTPEEVAKEYFFELINRSMIQPSEIGLDGRVKSCKVHDIMRELIVTKSIDENIIFISSEQENMALTDNFRHLVVIDSKHFEGNQSNIRSISSFSRSTPNLLLSSSSKLKLLRTLYLPDLWINDNKSLRLQRFEYLRYISIYFVESWFRKAIQNLRNLQTLQVSGVRRMSSNGRGFTKFIQNLWNLQTVQAGDVGIPKFNITKLHKLRHFLGGEDSWGNGIALDKGIRNLKELQSLKFVDIGRSHSKVVEELAKLPQLKKLGVTNLKREQFEKFSASLSKLRCLRSLFIRIEHVEEAAVDFLDGASSSPPVHLRSITLLGWIGKLPTWIPSLDNLAKISLGETKLQDDAIVVLQNLPNLILLCLGDYAYDGAELIFESKTFLKLRVLEVQGMKKLQEVVFQADSLPQLETLKIRDCDLKSGINGIEYLPRLKKITLGDYVYVANLDVVQKQVGKHPNRPALQVQNPDYQERMEAKSYSDPLSTFGEQTEEEAGPSHTTALQE